MTATQQNHPAGNPAAANTPEQDVFATILQTYLLPLLHGAAFSSGEEVKSGYSEGVAYDSAFTLRGQYPDGENRPFVLKRTSQFTIQEKELANQVVTGLVAGRVAKSPPDHAAINDIVMRAIAEQVCPADSKTLHGVLRVYSEWSEQGHAAHTVGLRPDKGRLDGINFFDVRDMPQIKILGAGNDSLLCLGRQGFIACMESMGRIYDYNRSRTVLAPVQYAHLALWTKSQGKVVACLTGEGDILLFRNNALAYAKRKSLWSCFPHKKLLEELFSEDSSPVLESTNRALYLTLLDLVFSRTASCIGLVEKIDASDDRIPPDSLLDTNPPSPEVAMLRFLVKKQKFPELSRETRLRLCSMGGSVVLSREGAVIAAGNFAAGGMEQGNQYRTSAASALSRGGIGLAVSPEGTAQIYRAGSPIGTFA